MSVDTRLEELGVSGLGEVDEQAFSGLAERHRRELHVHCYRMLGSFEDAEDTVQETFLRAWRRRETFEGRSTFRAWLYRIATNACLDLLAKSRPEPATGGSSGRAPTCRSRSTSCASPAGRSPRSSPSMTTSSRGSGCRTTCRRTARSSHGADTRAARRQACRGVAADWSEGVDHGGEWPMKLVAAKYRCVEGAKRVVDIAMDMSGGAGMFKRSARPGTDAPVRCA